MASPVLLFCGSDIQHFVAPPGQVLAKNDSISGNIWVDCNMEADATPTGYQGILRGLDKTPYPVPVGHTLATRCQYHNWNSYSNPVPSFTLWDNYGNPAISLWPNNSNNQRVLQLMYNANAMNVPGASPNWVVLPQTVAFPQNVGDSDTVPVQINLTLDSAGNHSADVSVNDTQTMGLQSFSFATFNPAACIASVGMSGPQGGYQQTSQWLARMDGDLTGANVKMFRPVAAGSHADWTGTFANVAEIVDNITTFNSATASGSRQSYPQTGAGWSPPSGYGIDSVWHWLTARDAAEPVRTLVSSFASGGADVVAATPMAGALAANFSAMVERYNTNPATAAAWNPNDFAVPPELGWLLQ
jgi:hypothetical protein